MKRVLETHTKHANDCAEPLFRCAICGNPIYINTGDEVDVEQRLCVRCHWCPSSAAIFRFFIAKDGTPSLTFVRNA